MGSDETQTVKGWLFPEGIDVPEEPWYRFTLGDTTVEDMNWSGHIDVAHQVGLDQLDTEVVASGVVDGLLYAAVKVTAVIDGQRFSSIGGADVASNQVKDPEHVFSVAESRAIKRAVKRALNIRAADEVTARAADEEGGSSGYDQYGHPKDDPASDVETEPTPEPPEPPSADADGDDLDW